MANNTEDLKKIIVALHKDVVGFNKFAKTLKLSCSTVAKNIQRINRTELKLKSDDKNYDEMYAASSLTKRDGTKMLLEDYRTFKVHPIS